MKSRVSRTAVSNQVSKGTPCLDRIETSTTWHFDRRRLQRRRQWIKRLTREDPLIRAAGRPPIKATPFPLIVSIMPVRPRPTRIVSGRRLSDDQMASSVCVAAPSSIAKRDAKPKVWRGSSIEPKPDGCLEFASART